MPRVKPDIKSFVKIKVIGLGGSGSNAVSYMAKKRIEGVEFIAANTDAQALHFAKATEKILLGENITHGLGTGMDIELGRKAAQDSKEKIKEVIKDADMLFISCGLGGGTGTSSAPVVAEIARDLGILTIAVVTKPFAFEGEQKRKIAEKGLKELKEKVDSIIPIPNDRLLSIINEKTTALNAFSIVDDVLCQAVQAISDLIVKPGTINVDFADINSIMKNSGLALMGMGRARGENRAEAATNQAINSPLLEISIDGARGVLFNISGGDDLTMKEIEIIAKIITKNVDREAKIIFGTVFDDTLRKNEVKVTVIATKFDQEFIKKDNQPTLLEQKLTLEEKETITPPELEEKQDIGEEDEKEWEIPAFLRKREKNKK
ncbi:MAG: cell division protein FtsZ [Candidatus Pacebacteria bacterium]|nr:cell division protein FtsZ [Candidatus Paceibacterota bacterium]